MTPDSFFKINPDAKSWGVSGQDKYRKTRPVSPPDGKKDFKKVLSKKDRKDEQEAKKTTQKNTEAEDARRVARKNQEAAKKQVEKGKDPRSDQPSTITKESKVSPRLGEEMPIAPSEEPRAKPYIDKSLNEAALLSKALHDSELEKLEKKRAQKDSPADLFGRIAQNKEGALRAYERSKQQSLGKENFPKKDELEISLFDGKESKGFGLVPYRPYDQDVASVNLFVLSISPADTIHAETLKEPVQIPKVIFDIVDEIISEIKEGITKTIITIKGTNTFQGAQVTVTTFKTAPGEMNIQFANLSQEGKALIDQNLDALKLALDQKGYTVHMIATTTVKEQEILAASTEYRKEERQPEDERQQGQEKEGDES